MSYRASHAQCGSLPYNKWFRSHFKNILSTSQAAVLESLVSAVPEGDHLLDKILEHTLVMVSISLAGAL